MRFKSTVILLSVLLAALTLLSALSLAASAAASEELTYTVCLNTAPAYRTGDKIAGGVNIISARLEYDASQLELVSDLDGSFKKAFPKLSRGYTVVNSPADGVLYFNSGSLTAYKFENDSDVLACLTFRYKSAEHGAPYIRLHIMELAGETTEDGVYDYLVKNDIFLRDGVRLSGERTHSGSGGYMIGDADSDGSVTSADATSVQRRLDKIPAADFDPKAADADGDGSVTLTDALLIQRYTVRLPVSERIGAAV